MKNENKKYFDLTADSNDIFNLTIKARNTFACVLEDKNNNTYDGLILAKTPLGKNLTVCDVIFQRSNIDRKYQARLIFRKSDEKLEDKKSRKGDTHIRIPFEKGQDGYRNFWQMIAFLYKWRETIDLGDFDNIFSVTNENLTSILPEIAKLENKKLILKNLGKLSKDQLTNIDDLVNATNVKKITEEMLKNKDNAKESYWQDFFEKNTDVLSQVFSTPYIFTEGQLFCGGKRGNNKGGVEADFSYQNKLTGNTAFIEIKTPLTELMAKSLYLGTADKDNNAIYAVSPKLTGAVNEVLNQKNIFIQKKDSIEEIFKEHMNFKSIVIAGTIKGLTKGQIKSFELYRGSLGNVEIVTYDELFDKLKSFLAMFDKK